MEWLYTVVIYLAHVLWIRWEVFWAGPHADHRHRSGCLLGLGKPVRCWWRDEVAQSHSEDWLVAGMFWFPLWPLTLQ